MEVRNLASREDTATVEWYFFGKTADGKQQFIFDHGTQQVTLAPATTKALQIESTALTSTVEKRLTLRSGYAEPQGNRPTAKVTKSGARLAGWVMRLLAEDQLLQVRASSPSLEAIGRDSAQLNAYPKRSAN